jgi:hypothetical protein
MATDLSLYLGNKIARWLGGNAMPTAPVSIYTALFNGDPKGAGTEVTTTIDAGGRIAPAWTVPAVGTSNVLVSSADVNYGLSDGIATITHVGIFDAAAAGNLLSSKALAAPVSAVVGTPIKMLAGDLSFTIGS